MEEVRLAALPFPLHPHGPGGTAWETDGTTLDITGPAGSDLFVDPAAEPGSGSADLTRLTGAVAGGFQLSARVTVDFGERFDAGAIVVHAGDGLWIKHCAEFSPARRGMVVSVVTREVSDDANAWDLDGDSVYLRVSRLGRIFALHASADGASWQLVRACTLGIPIDQPVQVGFLAQSPLGLGCHARFSDIRFTTQELRDIRDGS